MINKIKFTHNYPKLWNQKSAFLIQVRFIDKEAELHKDLIEYDTKNSEGEYYQLPKSDLIQLIFVGDKEIPFCTLRRYTPEKYIYYTINEGEEFEIIINKEGLKVTTKPSA